MGELKINVSPEASAYRVSDEVHPLVFVKLLSLADTTVLVSRSVTVMDNELNARPPVFFNLNSTHQPEQVSQPEYVISKAGTGVGVGGGVKTGRTWKFPARVAYSPHNQQKLLGESGLRTYQ